MSASTIVVTSCSNDMEGCHPRLRASPCSNLRRMALILVLFGAQRICLHIRSVVRSHCLNARSQNSLTEWLLPATT